MSELVSCSLPIQASEECWPCSSDVGQDDDVSNLRIGGQDRHALCYSVSKGKYLCSMVHMSVGQWDAMAIYSLIWADPSVQKQNLQAN
jgi:hypothetical protein